MMLLMPQWTIRKYRSDGSCDEVIDVEGNALMYAGSSAVWELLMGRITVTPFNETGALIGVGSGTAAPDPSQTNLTGGSIVTTNMATGYPIHLPGNNATAASIVFRSVFGDAQAEFHWTEVGLFNVDGRLFNRRVRDLGVKPAGRVWSVDVAFSIKPEAQST